MHKHRAAQLLNRQRESPYQHIARCTRVELLSAALCAQLKNVTINRPLAAVVVVVDVGSTVVTNIINNTAAK